MRLLFLVYQYDPIPDANGNCLRHLRENLFAQGVESDILTWRWDKNQRQPKQDSCGTIYFADSWMQYGKFVRDASGRVNMPLPALLRTLFTFGTEILLGGRYIREKRWPQAGCRGMGRELRRLFATGQYDWVVSCAAPFCNHETAAHWLPPQAKLALYSFDPYAQNGLYAPGNKATRLKEEQRVMRRANLILLPKEHAQDMQKPEYAEFAPKTVFLPFPNLDEPAPAKAECPVDFDKEKINCVFLGTLYPEIREPDALLALFAGLAARDAAVRLYIIGNKSGEHIRQTLAEYQQKMGDALICQSAVSTAQADAILQNADILVNLGNSPRVYNQLPSKLLDFIAAGKPVLNLCGSENCNTMPYVRRYPLGLNVSPKNLDEQQEAVLEFCKKSKGCRLNWAEISAVYANEIGSAVAAQFVQACQNAAKEMGENNG